VLSALIFNRPILFVQLEFVDFFQFLSREHVYAETSALRKRLNCVKMNARLKLKAHVHSGVTKLN